MSSKRPLKSSEKSKVIGVLDYFKGHSKEGNGTCIQQTVDATGVSRATIFRLQKELKEMGKLSSPERPHTRKAYKPIDDFDQTVIRNKIRQFYTHYKMLPTLRSLHAALKTEISYPGGLELSMTSTRRSSGIRSDNFTHTTRCFRPCEVCMQR